MPAAAASRRSSTWTPPTRARTTGRPTCWSAADAPPARPRCAVSSAPGPTATPWARSRRRARRALWAACAASSRRSWGSSTRWRPRVPPSTVVLADMCIPGYWLAALHRVPAPRRLPVPDGLGDARLRVPRGARRGARRARADRSVCGRRRLPVRLRRAGDRRRRSASPLTVVVVDDGGYGMLRFDQRRSGAEPYGVDLATPDFVALAQAFGMHAEAVDGLGDGLRRRARAARRRRRAVAPARRARRLEPPPTTSPRWYRAAAGPPGPAAP